MKKHYESSSNRNVEDALRGQYFGGGGNQKRQAVQLAAKECNAWLSPQALRSFCFHTLKLAELASSGDVVETARYRSSHSYDLHLEAEALAYSEAMRAWAESDAAPAAPPFDPVAQKTRDDAIRARARELRADAEHALEQHYVEVATSEWEAEHSSNVTPIKTPKRKEARS